MTTDPPCPVCEGAGYWDKLTGHPIRAVAATPPSTGTQEWAAAILATIHRCPYCGGTGKVKEASK